MFAPLVFHLHCDKLRSARDGRITFCGMEPPANLTESFMVRDDNQIMSLEMVSIALGEHVLSLCASVLSVIASCCRIVELRRRNCRSQSGGVV